MDSPDPLEEKWTRVAQALNEYLRINSLYHHRGVYKGHSQPCAVWNTRPLGDDLADRLLIHGLIPRNWLLIKRIDIHGKETLGDSEGN